MKPPTGSELQGLPARPRSWTACWLEALKGKDRVRSGLWRSLWLQSGGWAGGLPERGRPGGASCRRPGERGQGQPGERGEGLTEAEAKVSFGMTWPAPILPPL